MSNDCFILWPFAVVGQKYMNSIYPAADLGRSAWVGYSCLFVCLFVRSKQTNKQTDGLEHPTHADHKSFLPYCLDNYTVK